MARLLESYMIVLCVLFLGLLVCYQCKFRLVFFVHIVNVYLIYLHINVCFSCFIGSSITINDIKNIAGKPCDHLPICLRVDAQYCCCSLTSRICADSLPACVDKCIPKNCCSTKM